MAFLQLLTITFLIFSQIIINYAMESTYTTDHSNIDINESDFEMLKEYKQRRKNRPINFEQDNRIVGGVETTIKEHPFIVSLQMIEGSHMCGGSIINELWVLTACHCVTIGRELILRAPEEYVIVAGLSDITRILEHGQVREIEAFIKHPKFQLPLLHNDIALIKMMNPLVLGQSVTPVKLPKFTELQGQDVKNEYPECTALGWGAQKPRSGKPYNELTEQEKLEIEQDTIAPMLRQVVLPVITLERCKEIIDEDYITNRNLCTLYVSGGKDACEGDSGGPLMCGEQQYGITSWGHGCALPGYPGVFTRVDTFHEWISNVINGGCNIDPYKGSTKPMLADVLITVILYLIVTSL